MNGCTMQRTAAFLRGEPSFFAGRGRMGGRAQNCATICGHLRNLTKKLQKTSEEVNMEFIFLSVYTTITSGIRPLRRKRVRAADTGKTYT